MSSESVATVTSTSTNSAGPAVPADAPAARNRRQEETFRKVLRAGVEMLREKS
ncbi:TetR/AcrR family transcriptional regulator, partial [Mycobacterium stomatepiae]|nr:TetR/AcrR family transcriptional regulator [Mycobacterium stomatepiae]